MARFNYRCKKRDCRHRVTLDHVLEWYIREPKCQACKRRDTLRHDPWRRQETLRKKCQCGGILWPHRRNTVLDEHDFCRNLSLDDVGEILINRGAMSLAELSELQYYE